MKCLKWNYCEERVNGRGEAEQLGQLSFIWRDDVKLGLPVTRLRNMANDNSKYCWRSFFVAN